METQDILVALETLFRIELFNQYIVSDNSITVILNDKDRVLIRIKKEECHD